MYLFSWHWYLNSFFFFSCHHQVPRLVLCALRIVKGLPLIRFKKGFVLLKASCKSTITIQTDGSVWRWILFFLRRRFYLLSMGTMLSDFILFATCCLSWTNKGWLLSCIPLWRTSCYLQCAPTEGNKNLSKKTSSREYLWRAIIPAPSLCSEIVWARLI